jgi:hypothetical protein
MAQQDAVSNAKAVLAHANQKFPSPAPKPAAPVAKPTAKAAPTVGDELKSKSDNVNQYIQSLPKMHKGGEIPEDGAYQMKAGEHVLTAAEAQKARKHALMAAGMKSLAKTSPKKKTMGEPTENDELVKRPEKKATSDIRIRSEKNQSAKIKVQA